MTSKVTPKRVLPKHKEHTPYHNARGERVPSVTSIPLGWNTIVLNKWNNKMGLRGVDTEKYLKDKGEIGSLSHAFCTDYLFRKRTNMEDYSAIQIEEAKHSFFAFHKWAKPHDIQPIFVEKQLVSEQYQYGGTLDIYGIVDNLKELSDLKSGSGIYEDMIVQVAAYHNLLVENGYPVDRVRIINIPRSESENFVDLDVTAMVPLAFECFLRALLNHRAYNQLRRMRGYS